MNRESYPIPGRLNLVLCGLTVSLLLFCLWLASLGSPIVLVLAILGYAVIMNTGYALIHEAHHHILHPNRWVNEACGVGLALFFPAPFHLLRQGHLGHHVRNRSDQEAFDFYTDRESKIWRWLQLYGILIGLFWVAIVLGNLVAAVSPAWLRKPVTSFDHSTAALCHSLSPRYDRAIRTESWAIMALHGGLMSGFGVAAADYLAVLFGFGFLWSAMQYVHHFGTIRDVRYGARNLKVWPLLDRIWLNHNWHLNHHVHPDIPWCYLPGLLNGERFTSRDSMLLAYLRMWKGPRRSVPTSQHNRERICEA